MNAKPDPEVTCPYTGHKDKCREHYNCCPKWINVIGTDPQTGASVNQWDCADTWIPKLLIENSQMQRQTSAAVESLRNVVAREIKQDFFPSSSHIPKLDQSES